MSLQYPHYLTTIFPSFRECLSFSAPYWSGWAKCPASPTHRPGHRPRPWPPPGFSFHRGKHCHGWRYRAMVVRPRLWEKKEKKSNWIGPNPEFERLLFCIFLCCSPTQMHCFSSAVCIATSSKSTPPGKPFVISSHKPINLMSIKQSYTTNQTICEIWDGYTIAPKSASLKSEAFDAFPRLDRNFWVHGNLRGPSIWTSFSTIRSDQNDHPGIYVYMCI